VTSQGKGREMPENKARKSKVPWGLVIVMVAVLGAGVYFVKSVLSEKSPRKRNSFTVVTLLKPPPPPPVEKPPEPKIEEIQKEEIIAPEQEAAEPEAPSAEQDDAPAGDKLGVDAEGAAGSDAFGLVGKKGGRSLLAGDGGGLGKLTLLTRFAEYSQIVESEIRKKVRKRLDEEGGIPKGNHQVIARVSVDGNGAVVDFKIVGSSGDHKIDEAVRDSVGKVQISSPPPDGMPRTMVIRITSKG